MITKFVTTFIWIIFHLSRKNSCVRWCIWARPWENLSYVICEQQGRRSACASAQSDQRLCCSLLRYYNISRFYSRNLKTLASFCDCAGRFVSCLVGSSRRHVLSCRGSFYIVLFLSSLLLGIVPFMYTLIHCFHVKLCVVSFSHSLDHLVWGRDSWLPLCFIIS